MRPRRTSQINSVDLDGNPRPTRMMTTRTKTTTMHDDCDDNDDDYDDYNDDNNDDDDGDAYNDDGDNVMVMTMMMT